jgi:hypothetical protein
MWGDTGRGGDALWQLFSTIFSENSEVLFYPNNFIFTGLIVCPAAIGEHQGS